MKILSAHIILVLFFALPAKGENSSTLIHNVRIFDGVSAQLYRGSVLIENGIIRKISKKSLSVHSSVQVVDGGGRVLSPGFIDIHTHLMLQSRGPAKDPTVKGAYAAELANFYLDSGFTTIRDAGATHPDFAKAIESGRIRGPRVYPSGAVVSQTSGHGDWRHADEGHPVFEGRSPYINDGETVLADGIDRTLIAVRENLRAGATQVKIMGGGGVTSEFDPIHTIQSSPAEIRAAVQAASDWGTYILAHAYTSESVTRLIENGVRSIEHALLIDDDTAKLASKKGVVISTQLAIFQNFHKNPGLPESTLEKLRQVIKGQVNLIQLIKKYKITTGFGTDMVFGDYSTLGKEFIARSKFWTPVEILRQATSESAKVIRMAGKLDRHGKFGEIQEGWVADLILINDEPLKGLSMLESPRQGVVWVMKNGRVVKNNLKLSNEVN